MAWQGRNRARRLTVKVLHNADTFSLEMDLYKRWQAIHEEFRNQVALRDLPNARSWTFGDIQGELDSRDTALTPLFPAGHGVELIFEALRAWRDGVLLCPVESVPPHSGKLEKIPEGICHLKLTSGSTGEPKTILFRSEQLVADGRNIVETMGLNRDWPNLGVISLSHSYGFSNLVLPLLLHGVPLAWCGDPLPGAVERALETGEKWTLPAVPAMWRTWNRTGILKAGKVALAISAGAPLSIELEQAVFESSGVKVHNFYGASECGGIAYDRTDVPRTEAACVGTALENVRLRVGEDGCLIVMSAAAGEGMFPDGSNSTLGEGVFATSDLAVIDPGSEEVFLQSRLGEIINVAGRKVSPAKVEAAIVSALPDQVHACVVFGIPSHDPERVEEVVACVNGVFDPAETALIGRLAERLEPWEMPRRWWTGQAVEPDARGKISRKAWRETYLSRRH